MGNLAEVGTCRLQSVGNMRAAPEPDYLAETPLFQRPPAQSGPAVYSKLHDQSFKFQSSIKRLIPLFSYPSTEVRPRLPQYHV